MKFNLSSEFSANSTISQKYADVIIHVADKGAGRRFKAHKLVLADNSPYFDRVFQYVGNMPFVHVCFYTYHPSIVENAVKLLYGHQIEILEKHSSKFREFLKVLEVNFKEERLEIPKKQTAEGVVETDKVDEPQSMSENTSPEKPPPAKIPKLNKSKSKSLSPEIDLPAQTEPHYIEDKWTETTDERLDEIDFEVVINTVDGKTKKFYKCKHCEYIPGNVFGYAEQHFVDNHQNSDEAKEVVMATISYQTKAVQEFRDLKKRLEQGESKSIIHPNLVSLVEELETHKNKIDKLHEKDLFPTLRNKKKQLISKLGNIMKEIQKYLNK